MQLFYQPEVDASDTSVNFSKEESRHIVKVLRKRSGDSIHITNGKGWIFGGKLEILDAKHCSMNIESATELPVLPYRLHMAVAPTKLNDRFEWFLEKATEIGVSEITPILCAQSERKSIKIERFQKLLQSAMKQSLRAHLPDLHPLTDYDTFISGLKEKYDIRCIAHCSMGDKVSLKEAVKRGNSIVLLIGPEGDFTGGEIQLAERNGFVPIHLGDSRLRTETAAIVACSGIAMINQ